MRFPRGWMGPVVAVGVAFGLGTGCATTSPAPGGADVAAALDAWCAGAEHDLDLRIDLDAAGLSPFHRTVLETLRREVGWGEVVTYGELAALAGRPGAARAVGAAMATNPLPFVIPCHRVVRADGSLGEYTSGGTTVKARMLRAEGLHVRNGRIV